MCQASFVVGLVLFVGLMSSASCPFFCPWQAVGSTRQGDGLGACAAVEYVFCLEMHRSLPLHRIAPYPPPPTHRVQRVCMCQHTEWPCLRPLPRHEQSLTRGALPEDDTACSIFRKRQEDMLAPYRFDTAMHPPPVRPFPLRASLQDLASHSRTHPPHHVQV